MIAPLIPVFFNRRSENRAQVTYRASLGKPIVPIVFFQETTIHLKEPCHGGPVHFVEFCQLVALNRYGT